MPRIWGFGTLPLSRGTAKRRAMAPTKKSLPAAAARAGVKNKPDVRKSSSSSANKPVSKAVASTEAEEEDSDSEESGSESDDEEHDDEADPSSPNSDKDDENNDEDDVDSGKPPAITILLDVASLETVKTRKGDFQLLNCDDHISLLRKFKKDPADYRPDIIHQELMAVLDSPLNKAGRVRTLVHTEKNVLFEVNAKTRIPRTFKRFSGLMVQLLHRLKIRSADGKDMLLKVLKNPISRHLPAGAKCIGFSQHGKLQSPMDLAKGLPNDKPIVLIFGAQAMRGFNPSDHPYLEDLVAISEHPLSGVVAVNRVLGAIEHVNRIV